MNGTGMRAGASRTGPIGSSSFRIHLSPLTTPAQEAGGTTCDDSPGRDVFRHDRAGADQGPRPNGDAGHDDRTTTNRCSLANSRRHDLPVRLALRPAFGRGPGITIVDEHDPMANEHLVFDRHTLANEGVTRHLAPCSDFDVLLDLDRSEEHTSELQSPYVISYAVF